MTGKLTEQPNILEFLQREGWTQEEIDTYITLVEALSDEELRELHRLCHISMFTSDEILDREQALWVLINPKDTPKDLLITSINSLKSN